MNPVFLCFFFFLGSPALVVQSYSTHRTNNVQQTYLLHAGMPSKRAPNPKAATPLTNTPKLAKPPTRKVTSIAQSPRLWPFSSQLIWHPQSLLGGLKFGGI